jgi:hypothetical protein
MWVHHSIVKLLALLLQLLLLQLRVKPLLQPVLHHLFDVGGKFFVLLLRRVKPEKKKDLFKEKLLE